MVERPILRFPDPAPSERRTGAQRNPPRPQGPGREAQGRRFQGSFDRLAAALRADDPGAVLRADPAGIAPERALVFVTAGSVQGFARAARDIGLEVFTETDLEEIEDFPEGFEPPGAAGALSRTLYATMPTLDVFRRILRLWNAHQRGEGAPRGAGPWWTVFDLLIELRPWGPEDRLTEGARTVIEDRLPFDDNEEVPIEIEIWPAASAEKRAGWRHETEQRITGLGGRVIDRSSIVEGGFIYEALLAGLPAHAVRTMLADPAEAGGLATVEGVQLLLPQTIGQALPGDTEGETEDHEGRDAFVADAPIRAALLDGTPVAAHEALNGGVIIEDIHDLVGLSAVNQRYHATAMASLILRGDLESDGRALQDTRLVSVPLLVEDDNGDSRSPENRLFVDLVHTTLTRLLGGEEPLAADVFVVNFSIGVKDARFAGRISALARLLDWWAAREGVLFVISAGNINDNLALPGIRAGAFEQANGSERRQRVRAAMQASTFDRTLLAPAEALNGVTVGAISKDLGNHRPPAQAGIISLEGEGDTMPQVTSALGLGLHRTIKPDLLETGGRIEVRVWPNGHDTGLRPVYSQRTGLVAAAPGGGARGTKKSRGTSPAAALTTRAILQAAQALTGQDGPYEGQELPRRMLALLCRALAVNAARWPDDARDLYNEERARLGGRQHARAKEEVCRYFGYGALVPELMQRSPENGVTMVGFGTIRKDQARVFRMPLPASMAGERIPRSMRTTIAWFSPVNTARAEYRLAGLEAVAANGINDDEIEGWRLDFTSESCGPDANMVKRGSVWSRRMVNRVQTVPDFGEDEDIPICVQCRDTSGGGLSPDDDIAFALAVTLQVEAEVQYDIHDEIEQQVRLRLQRAE